MYVPRSDGSAVRPVVVCTAYASRAVIVPTTTGPTAEPSDRGTTPIWKPLYHTATIRSSVIGCFLRQHDVPVAHCSLPLHARPPT